MGGGGGRSVRGSVLTQRAPANDCSMDARGEPGTQLHAHLVCSHWWMREEGSHGPSLGNSYVSHRETVDKQKRKMWEQRVRKRKRSRERDRF